MIKENGCVLKFTACMMISKRSLEQGPVVMGVRQLQPAQFWPELHNVRKIYTAHLTSVKG